MRKLNEKVREQKAITLIALVITIIVLLILASVSIAMLTGENGILKKAATAKENTQISEVIERAKLDILEVQAENKGKFTVANLKTVLSKYFSDVPEALPDNLSALELTTKPEYGNYLIKASEIHNHSYVETELKDCSDEVKATYKFKGEAIGEPHYGSEAILYMEGIEVGDIVYVDETKEYYPMKTSEGYHKITSIPTGQYPIYMSTELIGTSYKVNVCSMCGPCSTTIN